MQRYNNFSIPESTKAHFKDLNLKDTYKLNDLFLILTFGIHLQ